LKKSGEREYAHKKKSKTVREQGKDIAKISPLRKTEGAVNELTGKNGAGTGGARGTALHNGDLTIIDVHSGQLHASSRDLEGRSNYYEAPIYTCIYQKDRCDFQVQASCVWWRLYCL